MRLKICKYCGRIHTSDFDCGRKPKRTGAKEDTEAVRLRNSRKWMNTRARARERDHGLCCVCLAQGSFTADALECHHIVPLVEDAGQAYELDNVIMLCPHHHKQAESGAISRGQLSGLVSVE